MNGGEVLVATLQSRGVDTVLFVAGGTFVTVLECLSRHQSAIRAVPVRLESSAVFAAEAYASIARKPACVFVSRAPGATNAAIGIHTAMQSSRPVVLFIANIPQAMKQREAFQEIDYRLMYAPVAKAVFDVHSIDELAPAAARALDLSMSGRPGPVVVSVSRDILDATTNEASIPPPSPPVAMGPHPDALARVRDLIKDARHPIVIAGEMVGFEGAHAALARLAESIGAGVLAAYRQQDSLANDHPAYIGQLSLNRLPHVERALDECDLLLALGTRFDSVTTADYRMVRDHHRLIMVYPDPSVFSQWQPELSVASDVTPFINALCEGPDTAPDPDTLAWRGGLHAEEMGFGELDDRSQIKGRVDLARVIETFQSMVPPDSILVSDAGTFGRWIQRYYRFRHPDTCLGPVSGAMGYGVPGGIGAALAAPGRRVFVWVGDGGFQMTGHEAATLMQETLPVTVIVCDNAAWGSILVEQQRRFSGWDFGTRLRSPDFELLGRGYGMPSFGVAQTSEFEAALGSALAEEGPEPDPFAPRPPRRLPLCLSPSCLSPSCVRPSLTGHTVLAASGREPTR